MRLSNTGFRPPVHDQVTPYEIPPIGPRPLVEPPLQNDDSRVRGRRAAPVARPPPYGSTDPPAPRPRRGRPPLHGLRGTAPWDRTARGRQSAEARWGLVAARRSAGPLARGLGRTRSQRSTRPQRVVATK